MSADLLAQEIAEQPAVWRRLADHGDEVAGVGAAVRAARPALVRVAAHGTSDHAATYATYVFRLLCGWTVVRDSMSLPLYYGTAAAAPGELAIGISQSGETPDVVAWLTAAREAGALTVAVTNGARSSLARAAEHVVAVHAGAERSIAATKTYTGTLGALALLAAHAAGRGETMATALRRTAAIAEEALPGLARRAERAAAERAAIERLYVIARGIELATAAEIALKLTEVCYLAAKPMSATAMAHGPVAALDGGFPVWVVASDDAALPAVREAVARGREAGAPLIVTGPAAPLLGGATLTIPSPAAPDPQLTPLLSVLPGQLFARALAYAKRLDPSAPRHLRKVTSAA